MRSLTTAPPLSTRLSMRQAYDWCRERRGEGQVSPCSGTIQCVLSSPTGQRPRANASDRRRPGRTGAHGDLFEGMMKIEFSSQKKIIIAGLAILIVADAMLALYAMQSATRFS